MLLNAEDLFVFMGKYQDEDLQNMSEAKWQSLRTSLNPNKPIRKLLDLARTIKKLDPDILMLCEIGGEESLQNFNQYFLDNLYVAKTSESNSDRGIDLAYLVKKKFSSFCTLKSFKDYELPHKKYNRFSRDLLELQLKFSKDTFYFYLVHLKSKLDFKKEDYQGRTRRAIEVRGLTKILDDKKNNYFLLAGDFNGEARLAVGLEPEFDMLYHQLALKDLGDWLNYPLSDRYSYLHLTTAGPIFQQLDYIMCNDKTFKLVAPETYHFPRYLNSEGLPYQIPENFEQKKLLASDHYPVYAEIDLPTSIFGNLC
jgi:endonuclease/exonuclease/phosphatase family metal-dependent hydrolase